MSQPFRFTGETNIRRALEMDDRVAEAFRRVGLKCLDARNEMCVAADVETLADASRYHDVPLDRILEALNALQVVPKPEPRPDA